MKIDFIIGLLTFVIFGSLVTSYYWGDEHVITVNDKEYVVNTNNDHHNGRYLIFTESGEAFANSDDIFLLKFNSSDIFAQLKKGERYRIYTVGFRWRLMSMYQNIYKIERLEKP